jgi:hypothetical protein
MSESAETDPSILQRAQHVEQALRVKFPPHTWMHLLSLTQDYLDHRGLLSLSRWRTAAETLEVDTSDLRIAFSDTDET